MPDGDAVDVRARHRLWIDATTQPALGSKGAKSSHVAKYNPMLEWHEVPQLPEDLESKSKLGSFIVQ